MKTYIYRIKTLSNLHVGNGEVNMGVIDNLVQRDGITGFPIINASSLKGALRDKFREYIKETGKENLKSLVEYVFGNEINNKNSAKSAHKVGAYRFFEARILSMPVRSDKCPFFMATCPFLLKDFVDTLRLFNVECQNLDNYAISDDELSEPQVSCEVYAGARIEDIVKKTVYRKDVTLPEFLERPVLLSDSDFSRLCDDDHLPIVARNQLDNGESRNLWYEQVVPRFTYMYFALMVPEGDSRFSEFNEVLDGSLVQIGGNATVGNGICKIDYICNNKRPVL